MNIFNNYSLKNLNTFGLDVFADMFVEFDDEADLSNLPKEILSGKKDKIILGSGSNILFTKDYHGLVFHSNIKGIKIIEDDNDKIMLEVGSGVVWDDLVNFCVENGFGGIENLSLIPGTAGAAPIQNIGAYGVEFEEVFYNLDAFCLNDLQMKTFTKKDCKFDYRYSVFKENEYQDYFIIKVRIKLDKYPKLKFTYRAIKDYLKDNNIIERELDLKTMRDIVINIRKSKLPDPEEIGNAGSFFKNPIVNTDLFNELRDDNHDIVYYKIDDNQYKIPAGWLIEKIGFKGKQLGNVGVHDKQALVLVNYGKGTGEELVNLANEIKHAVFNKFNINLETEVIIV